MDTKFPDFYSKKLLIVRIIWGALTMSIGTLAIVLFATKGAPGDINLNPLLHGEDPLLLVFAGLSLAIAIATFKGFEMYREKVVRERWDRASFISQIQSAKTEEGHAAYSAKEVEFIKTLDDRSLGIFRLHTKLVVASIIRYALTESIALFGFIAATQFDNLSLFFPFGGVALILMLLYFPKSELSTQVI